MTLLAACVASLLLLPGVVDEQVADERLAAMERGYAAQPGPVWEAEALRFADEAPGSQAAARALIWAGALALRDGRAAQAGQRFGEARRRFARGELGVLAARGLGDVAMSERHWTAAIARYDEALVDASPLLRHELTEKREMAERERARSWLELVAWLLLVACLVGLIRPLRTYRPELPLEARLLAPVYAVLVAAAWGRDPRAPVAMAWIAVGSLLLVTVAYAARRPGRRARDTVTLLIGTVAVIYIGLRRSGVMNALVETLRGGTDL
jgi:hypothetical protein